MVPHASDRGPTLPTFPKPRSQQNPKPTSKHVPARQSAAAARVHPTMETASVMPCQSPASPQDVLPLPSNSGPTYCDAGYAQVGAYPQAIPIWPSFPALHDAGTTVTTVPDDVNGPQAEVFNKFSSRNSKGPKLSQTQRCIIWFASQQHHPTFSFSRRWPQLCEYRSAGCCCFHVSHPGTVILVMSGRHWVVAVAQAELGSGQEQCVSVSELARQAGIGAVLSQY